MHPDSLMVHLENSMFHMNEYLYTYIPYMCSIEFSECHVYDNLGADFYMYENMHPDFHIL